ncbi:hypothetical protein GmHk_09G024758 [Glycine max]|uniref:Uncharacterized protein n=1 Tax=Glycine max TaxID=3847 RepID=K7LBU0_SOYBN|nr:hypothetical protein JHK85_024594 [Glycine max]KAH1041495.1 hypothetical protein GYH30_024047 [Glycine max]KAH1231991.1 hypothetical protein GmHk_09G024758 [Glycine max]KHN26576.1 hypothetical protein glysoja_019815 [Glycine soja]
MKNGCYTSEGNGFCPLKLQFVKAVHVKLCVSRATWAWKEGVYRKWVGVMMMFLQRLDCIPYVCLSRKGRLKSVMSFLVNELGFEASHVARCSVVLSLSFGKQIVPRGSVVLVLKSKGMVKVSLGGIFKCDEKLFLDKFIYGHDEKQTEELLKLYKDKMTLAG